LPGAQDKELKMDDRVGKQLGNYKLVGLLGRGAFAEVYLSEHIHLGTKAAIKLLRGSLLTPVEVTRFRQEARTVAALVHPHIVRVLEFGVDDDLPYLVMDYAAGGLLRRRHPPGTPLPLATVVSYVQQIAEGLQYAHNHKVIHRDIKPQNLLLGRNGEVLLSDFGISIVAENPSRQHTLGFAGTAAYAAPEQVQGHPRPASDQYSLGMIVYEWLTGSLPFTGPFLEVMWKQAHIQPPPLRDKAPTIPPAVEEVVLTALSKDPKERFSKVQAFANALGQASMMDQPTLVGPSEYIALPRVTRPIAVTTLSDWPPPPGSSIPLAPPAQSGTISTTPAPLPAAPGDDGAKTGRRLSGGVVKFLIALLLVAILGGGILGVILASAHQGKQNGSQPGTTSIPSHTPTPTLDPLEPYFATLPGPGCDQGGGEWAAAGSQSTMVSCSADGMQLTQPTGAQSFAEVDFYGPLAGTSIANNETITIDARDMVTYSCIGVITRHQAHGVGGYVLLVCRNGDWFIRRVDNTTGAFTTLASGHVTANKSYHLQVVVSGSSEGIGINGGSLHQVSDSNYNTTASIGIVVSSETNNTRGSALFSNFMYTPMP